MWLLLLALPLQGVGAATMLHCGPNHHRMLAGATTEPAQAHDHATGGHHRHAIGVVRDPHETAAAASGIDPSSVHHLNKLAKFKCSACAACCIGAALPTAVLSVVAFPPAMAPDSFVPSAHTGFVTDGPDRPPRLPLV